MKTVFVMVQCILFALTSSLLADVKYVSTTQLQMEGAVGTMMKLFGAGKLVKTVDYYKGDLKRSDTFDKKDKIESSQIVDLDKELFINVDHRKKEYSQMTFDEWQEMMKSAMEKISNEEYGNTAEQGKTAEKPQAEVDWST